MTATGYIRGHRVVWDGRRWLRDDGTVAPDTCSKCLLPPTPEGRDPCLGTVAGAIAACCGHGVPGLAYLIDTAGNRRPLDTDIADAQARQELDLRNALTPSIEEEA